jgi:hypothetical protein
MSRLGTFCLASTLIMLVFGTVSAQTTEITYQGRLNVSGAPAATNHDFEFRLYDNGNAGQGTLLGTKTVTNVPVTNGIFTVQLDFSSPTPCALCFNGSPRWLEISVKPAGGGSYQQLLPRQSVTSAPYSVKSLSADTAANATNATQLGGIAANQYLLTNGNGSGLTNLNAANITTGTLAIANGGTGTSTKNFVDLSTDQTSIGGNKTLTGNLTVNGNVGIGTTAPSSVLHVQGAQPPPVASGNGINATEVLRIVGGRGGDSFGGGGIIDDGGTGGSVLIQGGNGGDTPGGFSGAGGSITLQPGLRGSAVRPSFPDGNVLLAPNAGNVGIGTNNPAGKFHINVPGSGNPISALTLDVGTFGTGTNATNSYFFKVRDLGLGGTPAFLIRGDGNVGIGTATPTSKLDVSGTGGVRANVNSDSNAGFGLTLSNAPKWSVATVSPGQFQIFNDAIGQNAVWIDPATNNVGIGSASPAAKLEVNGYTKLGSDAPSIKVKKLTGTTAATEGGEVLISHGLDSSKILSISVMVNPAGSTWYGPNFLVFNGYHFNWNLVGGQIDIYNAPGASANILSKPVKILITYEQ